MKKQSISKTKIAKKSSKATSLYTKFAIAAVFVVVGGLYLFSQSARPADVNLVGSKLGGGVNKTNNTLTTKTTVDQALRDGTLKTGTGTNQTYTGKTVARDDDNPLGLKIGSGSNSEKSPLETAKDVALGLIFGNTSNSSSDKATGESAQTNSKPDKPNRCMPGGTCVEKSSEEVLNSITTGAGYKGEDEDGNKTEKEIMDRQNALGGRTLTTVSTKTDAETGNIHQTREIVIKDSSEKEVDRTVTTFDRIKKDDGSYDDKTVFTKNGKVVMSTGKGTSISSDGVTKDIATKPASKNNIAVNPEIKCRAGNVTVSAGTWVATGRNMGGDGAQRECVQIANNCSHGEESRACHAVYAENPAQVVLPSSAGTEYTVGQAPADVNPKQVPKVAANCITNGETVPSGNEREDVGVCDNGTWVSKKEFDRSQLALLNKNQGILKPTSFEGAEFVPGTNLTPDQAAINSTDKKALIDQARTYNTKNDNIYTGISISLGGKDLLTLGTQEGRFWPIIGISPLKIKDKTNDWDNIYSGINISWLGGDFVFGKSEKNGPVYVDLDRPTLPKNFQSGISSGAISCGPVFIAHCSVLGGVVGFFNDLFTDDQEQNSGTSPGAPAKINDTGPSNINNVNSPQTAGSTGGFNLSTDINNVSDFEDNRKTAKMSYFNQKNYSNQQNPDGSTWDESGCGIMSGAMVLSMVDSSITPADYHALLEQRGGVSAGGTSWFEQHKPILEEQGFNIVPVAGSTTHIANQINEYSKYGIPVWINSNIDNPDGSKGFGHQTLAVGTCPDGSCIVLNDPYYGENYEMPIERFDVDCSNTCDGGRTTWVVNAVIPPAEAK